MIEKISKNSRNPRNSSKPVFKIIFTLILIASLKREIIPILIMINYSSGPILYELYRYCRSSTVLLENSDGVNLGKLNI